MKWLTNIVKRWLKYEDGMNSGLVVGKTLAGVQVDEESSLGITAVWCAVSTISSMIAGLPLLTYQHLSTGKREAPEHPNYNLLKYTPSPELTDLQHWETSIAHYLLYGNLYSEIERDEAGRPVALHIIHPETMRVERDTELGLLYCIKVAGGQDVYLRPEEVFHVAGLSSNGLVGYSPIRLARESIALTKACENFGASFFGNSAKPAGVLTSPTALSPQARENLRKSWEQLHTGSSNVGRTAILEQGVSFIPLSIPMDDAQFLGTRGYQIDEISRIFNLSPVFLHSLGRATWGNLETLNRQLVQITLLPIMRKIEAECVRKLFPLEEHQTYFVEHDVTSLLRADTLTRYQAHAIATGGRPWMLPSEVRADERLDPVPDIDQEPAEQEPVTPEETDGTPIEPTQDTAS